MFDLVRRYRELLAVALLLILPVLLFLAGVKEPARRNPLDRAVLTVFAPVQKGVVWAMDRAQDAWFRYVWLVGMEDRNQALLEENLALRGEAARLEEIQLENERLRRLLAFRESAGHDAVVAPIIALNGNPALARSLRIGKGTEAELGPGLAVVTPEGVVGRVVESGLGWSEVLLLADPNSAVAVQVSRSRARGTVRGTGRLEQALLEHALRTDDLRKGDLLVTSGTGGVFPKGIPVGRVGEVERKSFGMFQHAQVTPSVDLTRLDEVVVLRVRPEPPAEPAPSRVPMPTLPEVGSRP